VFTPPVAALESRDDSHIACWLSRSLSGLSTTTDADTAMEGAPSAEIPFLPRLVELLSSVTRFFMRRVFNPTPAISTAATKVVGIAVRRWPSVMMVPGSGQLDFNEEFLSAGK
jgi:hypothetical protein